VECPDGFARVTDRALQRARTNPLGLLWRMIADGDHLLTASGSGAVRSTGACFVCGIHAEDALHYAGQWWCRMHEGHA
jgi:hypothetical protein